jgi:hypothetical protein
VRFLTLIFRALLILFIVAFFGILSLCLLKQYSLQIACGDRWDSKNERDDLTLRLDCDGVSLGVAHWHRIDSRLSFQSRFHIQWTKDPVGRVGWLSIYPPNHLPLGLASTSHTTPVLGQGIASQSIGSVSYHTITIPVWMLLALASIVPVSVLSRSLLRRWLIGHNRCLTCGYDLRATPDRCPECGTIPAEKKIISN